MNWKHKNKICPKEGEWRVRKAFCFVPTLDKDKVWHWLEYVGITEYVLYVTVHTGWFGDWVDVGWARSYIIDVELISGTLEIIGDKLAK